MILIRKVCPPADVPFLYEHLEYSTGVFQKDKVSGQWQVARIEEDSQVHWIAPDVTMLQDCDKGLLLKQKYPLLKHVHPVEIRVRAGEMLYLPSLWFHRVTQSCETIGINYWYEMKFDSPLWCYFSFLQQLQHGTGDEAVLALD
jgi:jumonji domain-containing protein 7